MSLTKIDRKFTFVGTKSELAVIFDATDTNVGSDAIIYVVPENATFEQRLAMAEIAAKTRGK